MNGEQGVVERKLARDSSKRLGRVGYKSFVRADFRKLLNCRP